MNMEHKTALILLLILGAVVCTGAVCKAMRLRASPDASFTMSFTVNSPADAADADPGDGACETAPGNQVCTLRAAIQETNALTGTDTIVLPAGTYTLTIPGSDEDAAATGDLDITDSLAIAGAGAAMTIIAGSGIDRVLHVSGSAEISGVTIAGGATDSIPGGGGILNEGSLALIDSTVTGNRVSSVNLGGGGIYNLGTLIMTNTVVISNTADGAGGNSGGGIYNAGTLIVTGGSVSDNVSVAMGAGMLNHGSASLAGVTIADNRVSSCTSGGGIVNSWGGTLSIANSAVISNTGGIWGGGIYLDHSGATIITNTLISGNHTYCAGSAGGGVMILGFGNVVTVVSSTIAYNSAADGGGIYNWGGELTMSDSTVSYNTLTSDGDGAGGGGIYNNYGAVDLVNVTLSHNRAISESLQHKGGGIYNVDGTLAMTNTTVAQNVLGGAGGGIFRESGTVAVKNSIVAGNAPQNCSGDVASMGHNIDSGATCGFSLPDDLANTDPALGPLQDNGGPTLTHALLDGSLAIDAADIGGGDVADPTTDQRGVIRPLDGDCDGTAVCDIGAYEYQPASCDKFIYLPIVLKN